MPKRIFWNALYFDFTFLSSSWSEILCWSRTSHKLHYLEIKKLLMSTVPRDMQHEFLMKNSKSLLMPPTTVQFLSWDFFVKMRQKTCAITSYSTHVGIFMFMTPVCLWFMLSECQIYTGRPLILGWTTTFVARVWNIGEFNFFFEAVASLRHFFRQYVIVFTKTKIIKKASKTEKERSSTLYTAAYWTLHMNKIKQ